MAILHSRSCSCRRPARLAGLPAAVTGSWFVFATNIGAFAWAIAPGYAAAEPHAICICGEQAASGPFNPDSSAHDSQEDPVIAAWNQAMALVDRGEPEKAFEEMRRFVETCGKEFADGTPTRSRSMGYFGRLSTQLNQWDAARWAFAKVVESPLLEEPFLEENFDFLHDYVLVLLMTNDAPLALRTAAGCCGWAEARLGKSSPQEIAARGRLALVLLRQGEPAKALNACDVANADLGKLPADKLAEIIIVRTVAATAAGKEPDSDLATVWKGMSPQERTALVSAALELEAAAGSPRAFYPVFRTLTAAMADTPQSGGERLREMLVRQARVAKAAGLHQESVDSIRSALSVVQAGEDDEILLLVELGWGLGKLERSAEADQAFAQAVAAARKAGSHEGTVHAHRMYARWLVNQSRFPDAEREMELAIEAGALAGPRYHGHALADYGLWLQKQLEHERAEPLLAKALEMLPPEDAETVLQVTVNLEAARLRGKTPDIRMANPAGNANSPAGQVLGENAHRNDVNDQADLEFDNPVSLVIRFPALLTPLQRQPFADAIDRILRDRHSGYVSGGGTLFQGERRHSDIHVIVGDREVAIPLIRDALRGQNAPEGTSIRQGMGEELREWPVWDESHPRPGPAAEALPAHDKTEREIQTP